MGGRDCRRRLVTCCDSGPVKTGCINIRNLLLYSTGFCTHRHFQIEWFTLLFPPVENKHDEGNLIQIFTSNDKGGKMFSGNGETMVFRRLVIRGTDMFWRLLSLFTQSVHPQCKEKHFPSNIHLVWIEGQAALHWRTRLVEQPKIWLVNCLNWQKVFSCQKRNELNQTKKKEQLKER